MSYSSALGLSIEYNMNRDTAAVSKHFADMSKLSQYQEKRGEAIEFLAHLCDHAFCVQRIPVTFYTRFSPNSFTIKISRMSHKHSLSQWFTAVSSQTLWLLSAPRSGAQLQPQQTLQPGPRPALSSTPPQLSSESRPLGTAMFQHMPCSSIASSHHTATALPRGKQE